MEKDPNKLYSVIAWFVLAALILLLLVVKYQVGESDWKNIILSVLSNLISTLLALIALYYILKKKFYDDSASIVYLPGVEEIKNLVNKQTDEIDNSLSEIKGDVDKILTKKGASSWEDYYNILANLRGDWLEFIPRREDENCEISIATFDLDKHDKHEFSGINFYTNNGRMNYKWVTEKVLPPIRHDDDTIYIYYIYKRYQSKDYMGKYGFGKLVAKREPNEPELYTFENGFFFNEATPENGHFTMRLISLKTIEQFFGVDIKKSQNDQEALKKIFKTIRESQIYSQWRNINLNGTNVTH